MGAGVAAIAVPLGLAAMLVASDGDKAEGAKATNSNPSQPRIHSGGVKQARTEDLKESSNEITRRVNIGPSASEMNTTTVSMAIPKYMQLFDNDLELADLEDRMVAAGMDRANMEALRAGDFNEAVLKDLERYGLNKEYFEESFELARGELIETFLRMVWNDEPGDMEQVWKRLMVFEVHADDLNKLKASKDFSEDLRAKFEEKYGVNIQWIKGQIED